MTCRGGVLLLLAFLMTYCGCGPTPRVSHLPPKRIIHFAPELPVPSESRLQRFESAIASGDWTWVLEESERLLNERLWIEQGEEKVCAPFWLIRRFSVLPPEFLTAYRDRYKPGARRVRGSGAGVLEWAACFYCGGMDVVGNALALKLLEQGESRGAFEVWQLILRYYPDPVIPREVLAARAIQAASANADRSEVEAVHCPEGVIWVGGMRRDLGEWQREAARNCSDEERLELQKLGQEVLSLGTVQIKQEVVGGQWSLWACKGDQRLPLVTCNVAISRFVGLWFWRKGETLGWASTTGLMGLVELETLQALWMGPLEKSPLSESIRNHLAYTLSLDRAAYLRLLDQWATVKKELLWHWDSCDQDGTHSDLLVSCDGAFWICPCGRVTPMELSGLRTVSSPSLETLPLPQSRRDSLMRAYSGN
jgi:hypothetical protein